VTRNRGHVIIEGCQGEIIERRGRHPLSAEGAQVVEIAALRYRAFLSYAHRDSRWAKWLHGALERYRIDKDLAGRDSPHGPVPQKLRPIFRDREDFSGGHSLNDATAAALDGSAALIVLCSTSAATRPAVNEEVRLFRSRHPARPVIPVIVEGTWPDNFPPALRHELAADGTVTDRPVTILGPDLRESGDGRSLGLAKVVAGLTGLAVDDLFRRAERARRRRNRFWAALAGLFLLLAVAASGSALYAWQQLKTNEAFLNATLERATEIVNTAVAQAEKFNVPRTATLDLLARAEGLFDDMARLGRPTPELRYRKAWMLIEFARNYAILGDTGKQRARAEEASRLLAELAAEKPDDTTYQRDLSVAYNEVGDVLVAQGKLDEALASYRGSLDIRHRLAGSDPSNTYWQQDLAFSYNRVGDVLVAQGKLDEALASYRASLDIRDRLAASDRSNAGRQYDLSVSSERVGEVLMAQGKLDEALATYQASFAIRERLAASDRSNAGWQRDLAVSYNKVGDVLVAQGKLDEALASYRASLAIVERLAASDRTNTGWQRDLLVSYEMVGNVLDLQGKLDEALASYRAGLAIAERLAASDRGNAYWQRTLSVSYFKVGAVLFEQGELDEALASYRASLGILQRLAIADRSNADWQRTLSVLYNNVGDVLVGLGKLDEALASYRAARDIAERLAASDRSNAVWQHDLADSHSKIAIVSEKLGNPTQALSELRAGQAIMAALVLVAPGNAQWQRDLAWFDQQIARIEKKLSFAP
jgi:tetratricopeptide (TPR) repeat protein